MIDYKELPVDGVRFEQLIRELLVREEYDVRWTGVGPDGGRDLLLKEQSAGPIAPFERLWLLSCKHRAHAGRSVGTEDLDKSIVDSCKAIGAGGFLLACTTQPSSALTQRLREIEASSGLVCKVWDGVDIERRLMSPRTCALMQIFFPRSAQGFPWTVYNAGTPAFWCGSHHGHFFYMASRVPAGVPSLKDMEAIIARLETVQLAEPAEFGQRERLRLRGVYFDDKNENYMVFVDYLVPTRHSGHGGGIIQQTLLANTVLEKLKDGEGLYSDGVGMWYCTDWDVVRIPCFQLSEGFDQDHQKFYKPFLANYETGCPRDGAASSYSDRSSSWDDQQE